MWGGLYGEDCVTEKAEDFSIAEVGVRYEDGSRAEYLKQLPSYLRLKGADNVTQAHQSRRRPKEASRNMYEPLGDCDIRVLELDAGDFNDELRGTLRICSTDFEVYLMKTLPEAAGMGSRTNFVFSVSDGHPVWLTALSYTWGPPAIDERWNITLHGQRFRLTQNLDFALRHLRQRDAKIVLWIDQVCIDQTDSDEKAHQVARMGLIYRLARNTVAWIGERRDGSDAAVRTLRDVNAILHTRIVQDDLDPAMDLANLGLPEAASLRWKKLHDLFAREWFAREWFARVWIIQEVALSHRVHVMCGPDVLSWDEVNLFSIIAVKDGLLPYLKRYALEGEPQSHGCERAYKIDTFRNLTIPTSMLTVLEEGRDASATLARDKVYGLMALCRDPLKPDYSTSHSNEDVLLDVALKALSLELLYCVDHDQLSADSPSWVPDWSCPRRTWSLGFRPTSQSTYHAAKNTATNIRLEQSSRTLYVTGKVFQAVTEILGVNYEKQLSVCSVDGDAELEGDSVLTWDFLASVRSLALQSYPYPSGSTLFEVVWMTLVAGGDHTAFQPAPSAYADVFSLLFDTACGSSPSFPDQPPPQRPLTLSNLTARQPAKRYRQIRAAAARALRSRRVSRTVGGYLGIVPRGTLPGDRVAVFLGGHVPFVIREHAGGAYQLIGECYVHGIMKGEVMFMEDVPNQNIVLV